MFDKLKDKIFLWAIKYLEPDKNVNWPEHGTICTGLGKRASLWQTSYEEPWYGSQLINSFI